ncbi:MAG: 30S ribosomal protein S8 [Candidatus Hodgkinia cicadicola]
MFEEVGCDRLDPISEVTSRVNNCIRANRKTFRIRSSKLKVGIVKLLKTLGCLTCVANAAYIGREASLTIELKHVAGRPMMRGMKQISRPGRREYWTARQAKFAAERSAATFILSTNAGLVVANESLKAGGEIICKVEW